MPGYTWVILTNQPPFEYKINKKGNGVYTFVIEWSCKNFRKHP